MLIIGLGEKLRERLDRLEALAALAAQNQGSGALPVAQSTSQSSETGVICSSTGSSENEIPTDFPVLPPSDTSTLSTGLDCGQLYPQLEVRPSDLGLWDTSSYNPLANDPSMLNMWDPTTLSLQPNDTLWCPTPNDQRSNFTRSDEITWDPIAHDLHDSLLSPEVSNVSESIALGNASLPFTKIQNDPLGLSWTTTIHCGCLRPHFQVQSCGSRSSAMGQVKILTVEPSSPTADPYTNNLRVDQLCTLTALFSIAMHIKISQDVLCNDDLRSPFFQICATSADALAKANMVTAVKKSFKTLKPDMRPTHEQITIDHSPYIDIIPFPGLRNNLIKRQGEFDEEEFFLDLLTGLVCWGGAGVGKRDRNASTGKVSTGTAWDPRSWEGQQWFVQKYWHLLGGEEGDLVRQTEWWRSMRGDDPLDVVEEV